MPTKYQRSFPIIAKLGLFTVKSGETYLLVDFFGGDHFFIIWNDYLLFNELPIRLQWKVIDGRDHERLFHIMIAQYHRYKYYCKDVEKSSWYRTKMVHKYYQVPYRSLP